MNLFSFLGIKVQHNFFEKNYCNTLVNAMQFANKQKARIRQQGKGIEDETIRNTYRVNLAADILEDCHRKIRLDLKPNLEAFFKTKFTHIQPLEFLSYDAGHFFKPHIDIIPEKNKRKVSVVIFLNQQGNAKNEADYGGGNLCLYGLRKNFPNQGLAIPNTQGLMVAFKSDVLHEVTPVEWGNRCSLVVWLE